MGPRDMGPTASPRVLDDTETLAFIGFRTVWSSQRPETRRQAVCRGSVRKCQFGQFSGLVTNGCCYHQCSFVLHLLSVLVLRILFRHVRISLRNGYSWQLLLYCVCSLFWYYVWPLFWYCATLTEVFSVLFPQLLGECQGNTLSKDGARNAL